MPSERYSALLPLLRRLRRPWRPLKKTQSQARLRRLTQLLDGFVVLGGESRAGRVYQLRLCHWSFHLYRSECAGSSQLASYDSQDRGARGICPSSCLGPTTPRGLSSGILLALGNTPTCEQFTCFIRSVNKSSQNHLWRGVWQVDVVGCESNGLSIVLSSRHRSFKVK